MSQLLFILLVAGGILACGLIIGLAVGILFISPRFYHFTRIANYADYLARLNKSDAYVHNVSLNLAKDIFHDLLNRDYTVAASAMMPLRIQKAQDETPKIP